jgi:hypothetical protein
MIMRTLIATVLLLAVVSPLVLADDPIIAVPSGWTVDTGNHPHAASPSGFAFVAYKYKSDDPYNVYDRSIVVQANPSGTVNTTEFEGKVFHVAYSPSGGHLIAVQAGAPGIPGGRYRSHVLDNDGTSLWSKTDYRTLFFSATGEVIYAWKESEGIGGGQEIEIYDLAGTAIKDVYLGRSLQGVVVPGNGDQVIVISARSIICLNASSPPTEAWRIDLPAGHPDVLGVEYLSADDFVVQLKQWAALVVGVEGTIHHTYDPQALGDDNPYLDEFQYARYGMFVGPSANTITLFDRSSDTQTLDYTTGDLTPRRIDASRPGAEFVLGSRMLNQHLFFFSPTEVRVRFVGGS